MTTKEQKNSIRKKLLTTRSSLKKTLSEEYSQAICEKFQELKEYKNAKSILFYMPIKNEVNITPLTKNKTILLPKVYDNQKIKIHKINSLTHLKPGQFNVPEPPKDSPIVQTKNIDLVIVPGIGFDKTGQRIGFGKGYYDRLLKHINCPKIAAAYEFQVIENIPSEDHDEKVDFIITEKNIYFTPAHPMGG